MIDPKVSRFVNGRVSATTGVLLAWTVALDGVLFTRLPTGISFRIEPLIITLGIFTDAGYRHLLLTAQPPVAPAVN